MNHVGHVIHMVIIVIHMVVIVIHMVVIVIYKLISQNYYEDSTTEYISDSDNLSLMDEPCW